MAKRNGTEEEFKNPGNNQESGADNHDDYSGGSKSMPAYLSAALRISTSYPLGANRVDKEIIVPENDSSNTGNVASTEPVEGIMVVDYLPMLGISGNIGSALNRAMNQAFNVVRSQISGNRPYMGSDMMIARCCIDSLRDLYLYVQRIYYTIPKYSATNLYRPVAILEAMGLNAQDWINNAADLYTWLNLHKNALLPFPTVPIGNITARHSTFNMTYFTDGEIDSTQTYIVNQKAFWSYENVDSVKGITPRVFPATFAEFKVMWDEMYAALMDSTDIHIICADIRRAFGDKVVTGLPDTAVDGVVKYDKADAFLTTIMNATTIPWSDDKSGETEFYKEFRVYDDAGVLKCTPNPICAASPYENKTISLLPGHLSHLNMRESSPSENDIWNATRLRPVVQTMGSVWKDFYLKARCRIHACGTEVITGMRIVGMDTNGNTNIHELASVMVANIYDEGGTPSASAAATLITIIAKLANFDWHPPVVVVTTGVDVNGSAWTSDVISTHVVEDTQNYVPIKDEVLTAIHEASLLNEFGVD